MTQEETIKKRKELIKKIKKIEIFTSHLVNEQLAGQYQSVFKGRGMAFEEVREYIPGDDIRLIDWNVSARMNDIYVKLFVEERELTVMLLVDMSKSLEFGTQGEFKKEVVAEIAAILAFSAIKNNDRVGLIIFTDKIELFVPPKKGKKHVLRVIMEILNFNPKNKNTNIKIGIEYLSKVMKRKSVSFLISDFILGEDKNKWLEYEHALKVAKNKHDIIPVCVVDVLEDLSLKDKFPYIGNINFYDPESGEIVEVDTGNKEIMNNYKQLLIDQKVRREQLFRKMKVDFINIRTDIYQDHYEQPIIDFFRLREKRAARVR